MKAAPPPAAGSSGSVPSSAVLLGGGQGTLAMARTLKGAGFQVWIVTDETSALCFSSAVLKVIRWSGASADAVAVLENIARTHGLAGSLLIPAADPEIRMVSEAHERLSSLFVVMTSEWARLRWACDKSLAYERARELGVGVPRVYDPASYQDPGSAELEYPVVLKPSMRLQANRFTADRGWRADDWPSFSERYKAACDLVGARHVVVQQFIPGDGETQVSYAGLWNRGEPVISFTARRLRQYPIEFGTTSTFVETASFPDVEAAAETFLRSIQHHGLIEMEFKRDLSDGVAKLLDVNPRPWNWLGLAAAAGMDIGAAIRATLSGQPVRRAEPRDGVAWIFVSRDLVAASRSGRLSVPAIFSYAATLSRVRTSAVFRWQDPVPGLVDWPLSLIRLLRRRKRAPVLSKLPVQ